MTIRSECAHLFVVVVVVIAVIVLVMLLVVVQAGAASRDVYDAVFKACALEGDIAQAERVLKVMVDMGVKPESCTIKYVRYCVILQCVCCLSWNTGLTVGLSDWTHVSEKKRVPETFVHLCS